MAKTSREHRRLIARMRRRWASKNGVVPNAMFDCAAFIWKHADRKSRKLAKMRRQELRATP